MRRIRMRINNKKFLIPIITVCACILLEALFSAFPFFAFVAGRKGETHNFFTDSSAVIIDEKSNVVIQFEPTQLNSISFKITPDGEGDESFFATMNVYASEEKSPGSYRTLATRNIGIDSRSAEKKVYMAPDYKASGIMLTFSDMSKMLEVSELTVNPQYTFKMNYLRLALILAVAIIILIVRNYKDFFKAFTFRNAAIFTVILCSFGSAIFSGICFSSDGAKALSYEKGMNVEGLNPYIQQLDAFEKGQLNIDVELDPALLEMDNPYDPFERGEASFLWDRAFKDGKYYSYFGTAPIFTAYYPFYLITDKLPADSVVMAFFAFIVSVFLPLAVMLLSKLINSGISPWFASMTAFGALGASMVFLLQRGYAPFYYIASVSAMAFGSVTVFWALLAYISKRKTAKILSFFASGISFALCLHSRINMAFSIGLVLAAALLFYFIEAVKAKKIKACAINLLAFCAPVGIGAGAAMWYNYARFSSPFDFGSAYQLTVADTSAYTLSASEIFPMIYHYFFRVFDISPKFPFVKMPSDSIPDIGKYVYTDSSIGIFAMPFMLAILLAVFVFKSKSVSKKRKLILACVFASMLITAFVDTCLGGVIFRYTADITLIGVLASAGIIFQLYSVCDIEKKSETKRIVVGSSAVLCSANVLATLASMLMLNANLFDYSPIIFEYFRSLVVFWK